MNKKSNTTAIGKSDYAAVSKVVPRGPTELGPNYVDAVCEPPPLEVTGPALTGLGLGSFYGWLCARSLYYCCPRDA